MSRKRYISTEISTDDKMAELSEYGLLPLLLFSWAIPHMDDWGRITGEARQFKLLVCPALDVSSKDVDEAITSICVVGLWIRYEIDGKQYISAHEENWFKHQSYINKGKRGNDSGSNFPRPPQNAEEQRRTPKNSEDEQETPQNPASFSFTPSFSLSPSSSTHNGVLVDEKGKIQHWLREHSVKCKGVTQLEDAEAYVGKMDIEVIEHCIKLAEGKHVPYLVTIFDRHIDEGKTTKESIRQLRAVPDKKRDAELESRDIEIARNQWIAKGNDPDEFRYNPASGG